MMVEQITTLGLLGLVMVSIIRRSPKISSSIDSHSVLEYAACGKRWRAGRADGRTVWVRLDD